MGNEDRVAEKLCVELGVRVPVGVRVGVCVGVSVEVSVGSEGVLPEDPIYLMLLIKLFTSVANKIRTCQ